MLISIRSQTGVKEMATSTITDPITVEPEAFCNALESAIAWAEEREKHPESPSAIAVETTRERRLELFGEK
jgi:hypothetical protein